MKNISSVSTIERNNGVIYLPISQIKKNPFQPRQKFTAESLKELTDSIREYGVLQPITVRELRMGAYELVAGERRLMASKQAGLKEIPALAYRMSDNDSAVIALIENVQRENLGCMEEAEGLYRLLKEHGYTQVELAKKLGFSQSAIANKVRLVRLSPKVKQSIRDNFLSERHARALLKLPDEKSQLEAIDQIKMYGMTTLSAEQMISQEAKYNDLHPASKVKTRRTTKSKFKLFMRFLNMLRREISFLKNNGLALRTSQENHDSYIEFRIVVMKRENGIQTYQKESSNERAREEQREAA